MKNRCTPPVEGQGHPVSAAAKHTPGPWEQSHRKTGPDSYSTQVYTPDGEIICTLHWYPKPKDERGGVGTYRDGNARLIAAAPDLLAAAKAKLADCDGCKDAALIPGEVCSDECAALVAAIAKAEGRS